MARGGRGGPGMLKKVTPGNEFLYGTDEEIAARDKVARQPDPTFFRQIGPEDNAGMNLANPTASNRSGNIKFGRGINP